MAIALDATYSVGAELSGVGVYCHEVLHGLAAMYAEERFWFCYRSHRYLRAWREKLPRNAHRFFLHDAWPVPSRAAIFHGLNQRMPHFRLRRSVCTFHDLFVLTGDYSTAEFRHRFSALARHAAERSDLIVAVSQFTADQVSALLGVECSRIRVIHHGVRTFPQKPKTRERIVLHVGAIQRRKNVAALVRAFESVSPDWRLVLVGSMGFGAEEAVQAIERSPARGRIEVTGYISLEALADWYRRASVFAFPSLDEGFGMPALEAMAQGIPVLSSNGSALLEVCGDAALLVNPYDENALTQGLVRLTADSVLRDELTRKGQKRAEKFTWGNAVKQTYEVYRELGGVTT